jgi:hypothetical protein
MSDFRTTPWKRRTVAVSRKRRSRTRLMYTGCAAKRAPHCRRPRPGPRHRIRRSRTRLHGNRCSPSLPNSGTAGTPGPWAGKSGFFRCFSPGRASPLVPPTRDANRGRDQRGARECPGDPLAAGARIEDAHRVDGLRPGPRGRAAEPQHRSHRRRADPVALLRRLRTGRDRRGLAARGPRSVRGVRGAFHPRGRQRRGPGRAPSGGGGVASREPRATRSRGCPALRGQHAHGRGGGLPLHRPVGRLPL